MQATHKTDNSATNHWGYHYINGSSNISKNMWGFYCGKQQRINSGNQEIQPIQKTTGLLKEHRLKKASMFIIGKNMYQSSINHVYILGGPLDNYSLQELKAGFLHFRDPFSTFQSFIFHTSNSDFPRLKAHFSTF